MRLFPTTRRAALSSAALALTVALAGPALAAEPEATPESRAHFRTGVEAAKGLRWEEALREFRTAYEMTPRWTALGNIGIAADHLERDGEAVDALEQYLKRGGAKMDKKERREVRDTLERLQKGLVSVTLAAAGSFSVIDTRLNGAALIVNEYGPFDDRVTLRVRAGEHQFTLARSALEAPAWSATLFPGDSAAHEFLASRAASEEPAAVPSPAPPSLQPLGAELPPFQVSHDSETDERSGKSSHTVTYALLGTGAAAAVATGVFLLQANRVQDDADAAFRKRCTNGVNNVTGCGATTPGDRSAANWRTAALVSGIGAAGALLIPAILYFVDDSPSDASPSRDSSRSSKNADSANVTLLPWVSPSAVGVSARF
jgi:hypothetical protein